MSEKHSPRSSRPFFISITLVLLIVAIAFGVSRWSGSSPGEETSGEARSGAPSSTDTTRSSGTGSAGQGHDGKAGDKSEEERIAGKPARVRRETPKQTVERVTMEAEEELRLLRQRARRSRAKSGDAERETQLNLLLRGQDHWRMTEEIAKNSSLRGEATALNRKLAKWMENAGQMDRESFEAGFRELRSELGKLRSRNGSRNRSR
ncbi:MAG: hypothetical protein GWO24_01670 [Akkermansiaceae bacterium]|nr:hypothetical protein [Akkermansiaceae bacterium]